MIAETTAKDWVKSRRKLGTHVFLLSCMALVGVFFTWASLGKLDVVSMSMGQVVPAGKVKSGRYKPPKDG